jgi:hypothetical protein
VFTLPSEYHVLWQYNQRWFVSTFFEVVRSTLMDLMGDESKHGVKPGVLMAMHTWGRQLTLHPHIHCVVTGGGVDGSGQWKPTGEYLLAAGQVRTLYRGRFQAMIKAALDSEELVLPPDQTSQEFQVLYKKAYTKRWCVRIEPQYAHGRGVLKYLSRYLRGGPIHASQIVRCDTDQIGFRYKDHRRKRTRLLSVKPEEFMRRLLLHVPEPGQHMVRHYGLYAGAARNSRNACREQLGGLMEKLAAEESGESEPIHCRDCRSRMRVKWVQYPRRGKANSYRVDGTVKFDARYVQQVDEPDTVVAKKRSPVLRV